MQELVQKSDRRITTVPMVLQRNVPDNINWEWRLNCIVGVEEPERPLFYYSEQEP